MREKIKWLANDSAISLCSDRLISEYSSVPAMAAADIADVFLSFPKATCELAKRKAVAACRLEGRIPTVPSLSDKQNVARSLSL